jgi:tryptophan-rich sensory protein
MSLWIDRLAVLVVQPEILEPVEGGLWIEGITVEGEQADVGKAGLGQLSYLLAGAGTMGCEAQAMSAMTDRHNSRTRTILGLVAALAASFAPGWFGSQFMPGVWYAQLVKPSWTPPNWLFGPVWTALYAMMAVAAWLVWKRDGFRRAGLALGVFIVQLVLNGVWSWLFFGLQQIALAFFEIVALWAAILAATVLFWRRARPAGILMLPYLAWVTYAAALNFALWRMNA